MRATFICRLLHTVAGVASSGGSTLRRRPRFVGRIPFLAVLLVAACREAPITAPPVTVVPLSEHAELSEFPPGQSGAFFVSTQPGDIATLNPLVAEDASSSGAIARFLEGLIRLDTESG